MRSLLWVQFANVQLKLTLSLIEQIPHRHKIWCKLCFYLTLKLAFREGRAHNFYGMISELRIASISLFVYNLNLMSVVTLLITKTAS